MDEPIRLQSDAALRRDPAPGLAARLLTRIFFRPAAVMENRQVAEGLHLITLEGAALRDLPWSPGDKLQVRIGPGLLTRTYTPTCWDTAHGSTQILRPGRRARQRMGTGRGARGEDIAVRPAPIPGVGCVRSPTQRDGR